MKRADENINRLMMASIMKRPPSVPAWTRDQEADAMDTNLQSNASTTCLSEAYPSKQTQCSGAACWSYISRGSGIPAAPSLWANNSQEYTDKSPGFLTQSSCWQGRRYHSERAVKDTRSSTSLEGVLGMVATIVAMEVSFVVPASSRHLLISFPGFVLVTEPSCS